MPMDYAIMTTRQRKWMFYLLALLMLGWGFTPYKVLFLSLTLGSVISFFNLWLLQRKINQMGQALAERRSSRALGTFSRFAAAGLAILIALRYEEFFHVVFVVIGLMTAYFVITIEFIYSRHKEAR